MQTSSIMDIAARELLAVLAVAHYGSFNAAALTIGLSQPALTRTIQRVEEMVGIPLFKRNTRRVEITPAGREFVAVAERVVNDLRVAARNMRDVSAEQRGQVIVACVMSVATTTLPTIVREFRLARPMVEVHVREGLNGAVVDDIRTGVADIGISYIGDLPENIDWERLGKEVFHVVLPTDHPLKRKRSIALGDLQNIPMVSLSSDARTRRLIEGAASSIGVMLDQTVTVTQVTTIMSFVEAGIGVAIVPSGTVAEAKRRGLITRPMVEPKLSRELGLIMLRHRDLTPSALALAAQLRAQAITLLRQR